MRPPGKNRAQTSFGKEKIFFPFSIPWKRKVSRGSIITIFLDIYYLLVQQFDFMCFDTSSPLLRCLAVCLGKKVQADGQYSSWRYRKYPRTNRYPVQTLPGKPELEALEHNLIRRQNTLSIKNLCRSLFAKEHAVVWSHEYHHFHADPSACHC